MLAKVFAAEADRIAMLQYLTLQLVEVAFWSSETRLDVSSEAGCGDAQCLFAGRAVEGCVSLDSHEKVEHDWSEQAIGFHTFCI